MNTQAHISVLKTEALEALAVQPNEWYIDATFGRGGHTRAILEQGGNVMAFDCDATAIAFGEEHFAAEISAGQLILVHQNFDRLETEWNNRQTASALLKPAGIFFDFGVSSPQIDTPERGFSFLHDGPLDMRMDERLGVQAKDLLAVLPEKQLAEIFWLYAGEEQSRRLAKAIKNAQAKRPFTTTTGLADFIAKIKPRTGHLHPATKVFQALRIAVNSEMQSIESALPQALQVVRSGGRIVTISFHEGEDRIAKHLFQDWEKSGQGQQLTKKAVMPGEDEQQQNNRSRSAKLRIFEKTQTQ
jgi:16S rRNA (cytosine1402-N4)-methyltransferase